MGEAWRTRIGSLDLALAIRFKGAKIAA